MKSTRSVPPTAGLTRTLLSDPPATPTLAEFVERSEGLVNRAHVLKADADVLHSDVLDTHTGLVLQKIDARAQDLAARGAAELLNSAAGSGLAWRDIASIVGVSVPAVRKWRSGGSITGDNLLRIAQLVALLEWLSEDQLIIDVASWLEVPLVAGTPINRLRLLAENHLTLLLGSVVGPDPAMTAQDVLDAFDQEWRTKYDSDFEVVVAPDGERSIRAKKR